MTRFNIIETEAIHLYRDSIGKTPWITLPESVKIRWRCVAEKTLMRNGILKKETTGIKLVKKMFASYVIGERALLEYGQEIDIEIRKAESDIINKAIEIMPDAASELKNLLKE